MVDFHSKHFNLEKVSEGIYAAIAKDGGGAVGNAGFVDLGGKTLVFDTFNTQQAAQDLRTIAEDVTKQPVTWVINSHYHGDHIRGNQVFKDCQIVSSSTTYNQMKETHPERIAAQKNDIDGLRKYIASLSNQSEGSTDMGRQHEINFLREIERSLPTLELVLPGVTFTNQFSIIGTTRTAQVMTFGGAHSPCDAFLYLPDDGVIFMADLLFVQMHPSFIPYSNPIQWVTILNKIKDFPIQKAIPGHGSVGTKENLVTLIDYINELIHVAKENWNEEEISIPVDYRDWKTANVDANVLFNRNVKVIRDILGETASSLSQTVRN